MKKKGPYLIIALLLVVGLAVLFYPSVSSWYNEQYQIRAVVEHDRSIERMPEETIAGELAKAREYNAALAALPLDDPFAAGESVLPQGYSSILNTGNGIMGSIEIPRIRVNLPVYHGTGTQALEKGVGHMEMTAFPIGGEGGHAVLTGHTGLPDAKLLTDLTELEEGDIFVIKIYKQTLAYQVDQITVVLPSDTAPLRPEPGKDYVSLVTCTPYGVNSHRLLVRGVRVPYTEGSQEPGQAPSIMTESGHVRTDLLIALSALVIVVLVTLAVCIRKTALKRRRHR